MVKLQTSRPFPRVYWALAPSNGGVVTRHAKNAMVSEQYNIRDTNEFTE